MNYFEQINKRVEELDALGEEYLAKLDFLPNDVIMDRIHAAAYKIFTGAKEDWKAVPEWVASCMDGWIPYSGGSRNGSLFHALALSVVSRDAHLRNLLEIAEGRETKELEFPVMAEAPIIPEEPIKPKKRRKAARIS